MGYCFLILYLPTNEIKLRMDRRRGYDSDGGGGGGVVVIMGWIDKTPRLHPFTSSPPPPPPSVLILSVILPSYL